MNFKNVRRNEACPCGSGKKFKHCHGSLAQNLNTDKDITKGLGVNGYYQQNLLNVINDEFIRDLPRGENIAIPPGLLTIDNFLDDEICNRIIEMTERKKHIKATIVNTNDSTKDNVEKIVEDDRKTEIFFLDSFNETIKLKLETAFKNSVKYFYSQEIECYEQPHILRYSEGGFYNYHADSEYWNKNQKLWTRSMQRDFSFLLYLNDDFTGGELVFKNFNFTLKPKKGLFVCFPSDHRFVHKVNPTISGLRYAIVSWAATRDSTKTIQLLGKTNEFIFIK